MLTTSPSEVRINVRLEVAVRQVDDQWIACCAPLDVMTQASTREDALGGLKEAVELWFESCLERGVLDEAMTEVGFHRYKYNQALPEGAKVMEVTTNPANSSRHEFMEVSIPACVAA
jgi:predicted RNase H-like HicB family nuclease